LHLRTRLALVGSAYWLPALVLSGNPIAKFAEYEGY
jgi:hypothetical protein